MDEEEVKPKEKISSQKRFKEEENYAMEYSEVERKWEADILLWFLWAESVNERCLVLLINGKRSLFDTPYV